MTQVFRSQQLTAYMKKQGDDVTLQITPSDVLLWLSLLSILSALIGIVLLPQNGPMKVALNRPRLVLFIEGSGLLYAIVYAAFILGYIR